METSNNYRRNTVRSKDTSASERLVFHSLTNCIRTLSLEHILARPGSMSNMPTFLGPLTFYSSSKISVKNAQKVPWVSLFLFWNIMLVNQILCESVQIHRADLMQQIVEYFVYVSGSPLCSMIVFLGFMAYEKGKGVNTSRKYVLQYEYNTRPKEFWLIEKNVAWLCTSTTHFTHHKLQNPLQASFISLGLSHSLLYSFISLWLLCLRAYQPCSPFTVSFTGYL